MSDLDQALTLWGGATRPPRLISDRENAVYEVFLPAGHAALRLHRTAYQTRAAIRSELDWTEALATAGISVPRPIPATDGTLVPILASGRAASVVTWVEGTPLGAAYVPLAGTEAQQSARFHAIGTALARLHDATDAFTPPPGFTRPAWDEDGLLGPDPLWGRFWDHPLLTAPEAALLQQARHRARARLDALRAEGGDYGLIHADLMRENMLLTDDAVTFIDFDELGLRLPALRPRHADAAKP